MSLTADEAKDLKRIALALELLVKITYRKYADEGAITEQSIAMLEEWERNRRTR